MASCEIQIVNPSVLSRIESYLNDTAYREAIENSANYNTRLCLERRLRLPFLDSQTGIAQNHSNLFMSGRERIPGMTDGQVYTYPSKRWRKKRRQYLMQPQVQLRRCDIPGTGGASSGGVGVGSASSAGTAVGSGVGPGTGGDSSSGGDLHSISTVENPAVAASTDDSKDSNSTGLKDDPSGKSSQDAWFYEELELQGMDGYDDVDPDSDYDYEETYSKRRKKRGGGAKPGPRASGASVPAVADSPHPKKGPKGTGQGRGRKKGVNYAEMTDSEKPFSCDLCGARYKTRPGLTYHYTHSHKERSTGGGGGSGSGSGSSATAATAGSGVSQSAGSTTATVSNPVAVAAGMGPPVVGAAPAAGSMVSADEEPPSDIPPMSPPHHHNPHQDNPAPGWTKFQDSYLTFLNAPGSSGRRGRQSANSAAAAVQNPQPHHADTDLPPMSGPSIEKKPMQEPVLVMEQNDKERAAPSPYCDFCLGDAVSNKKSGQPEELVSCSDCGRSGHPSCLQFTDNMIISVRKYRWQCIECKCCSICGTSDNDDQLLFCDDCDRGYHMYCLSPPLEAPPEGSWSCRLCIVEFHTK